MVAFQNVCSASMLHDLRRMVIQNFRILSILMSAILDFFFVVSCSFFDAEPFVQFFAFLSQQSKVITALVVLGVV